MSAENKRENSKRRYWIKIITENDYDIDYLYKSSIELKHLVNEIRKKEKTVKDLEVLKQKILDEEDREEGEPYIPISQKEFEEDLNKFYGTLESENNTELIKRLKILHDELTPEQRELVRAGQSSLLYGKGGKKVGEIRPFEKSLKDSLTWLDELKKKNEEKKRLSRWIF